MTLYHCCFSRSNVSIDRLPKCLAVVAFLFAVSMPAQGADPDTGLTPADKPAPQIITDLERRLLRQACSVEHGRLCAPDSISVGCLAGHQEKLGQCCAAKIRDLTETPLPPESMSYQGIELPAGSSLQFDSFCRYATAVVPTPVVYRETGIVAGPLVFSKEGQLALAILAGNQTIHNLSLAERQPLTLLFKNATPKNIRLGAVSEQYGIKFGPLKAFEKRFERNFELAKISTEYLHQLILARPGQYDPGTTELHENGRVARGNVAEDVIIKGMPVAAGITTFTEDGIVVTGKLSGPYQYKELKLTAGEIKFSNNGNLREAVLAADARLNQWKLNSASEINMNYEGEPVSVLLGSEEPKDGSSELIKVDTLWLGRNQAYNLMPNGQIEDARIAGHSWYRGRMYPAGTEMRFDENGDVTWDSFYDGIMANASNGGRSRHDVPEILPTAEVRRGLLLPAGSLVYPMTRRGELRVVVPRSFDYRGIRISAGEFRIGNRNDIRMAYLEGDQVVKGLHLKGYPSPVGLTESGEIESASLASDQVINGLLVKKAPYNVEFASSGELSKATLAEETVIGDVRFSDSYPTRFNGDGTVLEGKLAKPTLLGGVLFKSGSLIRFRDNGNVAVGVLARKTILSGVELPADSRLEWLYAGTFKVETSQPVSIGTHVFAGKNLIIREDGSVQRGTITQDTVIDGERVKAGTEVSISPQGKLQGKMYTGLGNYSNQSNPIILIGPDSPRVSSPLTQSQCENALNHAMQHPGYWLNVPHILGCVRRQAGLD